MVLFTHREFGDVEVFIVWRAQVLPLLHKWDMRKYARTACGFNMQAIDLDRDGDLDLILGDIDTRYFERISFGELMERQSLNPIAAIAKNESIRLHLGTQL